MSLLELRKLNKHFGGLHVTNAVDLTLEAGEIHCLIGPNGAGKSTLFRLILGEHHPGSGDVLFAGENITALKSFARIRRGLSVKFQVPGVFKGLSVRQNLEIALQSRHRGRELEAEIDRLLVFLGLESEQAQTAGMSPEETHMTGEMVQRLNADGMTVLAIEHDMAFVRQVAQRVTVLHLGQVFAQGSIDEIVADERVAAIYLGQAHA